MRPRTFQRRLRAEGTSFHDILDDVRRGLVAASRLSERIGPPEAQVAGGP